MRYKTAIRAIENMTAADKADPTDFQVRALNTVALELARDTAAAGEPTYPDSIVENMDDEFGIRYCWMSDETSDAIDAIMVEYRR